MLFLFACSFKVLAFFFETNLAFKQAVERARRGKGPSLIVSNVVRLLPHSSSDDQRKYRTPKALDEDRKRDPLIILEEQCIILLE